MSDASKPERVFNFLEASSSACFVERRKLVFPDICAAVIDGMMGVILSLTRTHQGALTAEEEARLQQAQQAAVALHQKRITEEKYHRGVTQTQEHALHASMAERSNRRSRRGDEDGHEEPRRMK